ncbi:hypothetical protein [Azonexus hydrophilus]|uniref:Lipoprotein n=1 Tax=Azonexus hydrophilus TaxID=418702 RepID=A0ABZ2XLE3_9RHOO
MIKHALILSLTAMVLAGCDQVTAKLGIENPALKEAKVDAEGKAVGSACRHSGRAIEDCYAIYSWLPKASVYSGWREMDEYMRENQLETIAPQLPPPEPPGAKRRRPAAAAETETASTTAVPATPTETAPPTATENK